MFNWSFTFLILSLIAGIFGFSSLAGAVGGVAQVLSVMFFGLMVASLIDQEVRRRHL